MINLIDEADLYFLPKFHAIDDHTVAIGLKLHTPNKAKLPEEFHPVLKNAGQHIHWKVELGSSIADVMNGGEPIVKALNKGFKVTHKHCVISNMKKAIMEMVKDEEKRE